VAADVRRRSGLASRESASSHRRLQGRFDSFALVSFARHCNPVGLQMTMVRTLFLLAALQVAHASDLLPPGFRPLPPGTHALVGGKIVIKPGQVLDRGNIVIRDGFIKAVGADVVPPADARVWDMKGLTIYAGFIDPYLILGSTNPPIST